VTRNAWYLAGTSIVMNGVPEGSHLLYWEPLEGTSISLTCWALTVLNSRKQARRLTLPGPRPGSLKYRDIVAFRLHALVTCSTLPYVVLRCCTVLNFSCICPVFCLLFPLIHHSVQPTSTFTRSLRVVGYRLVIVVSRQQEGSCCHANRIYQENYPRYSA